MPQCKRDGCREEAQRYGKRLCPKHEAERKEHEAERKARSEVYFSYPKCVSCGTRHTKNLGPTGEPECPSCSNFREEKEAADWQEQDKLRSLDQCETVEELKDFIRYFILE